MERLDDVQIPSLHEFELLEIQVKAKGGHVLIKWGESWEKDGGSTTWSLNKEIEAPRFINDAIFVLLDRVAEILAKQAGLNFEEIALSVVKFFERADSVKLYDLGVKFKVASEKETRSISRITIADLSHKSTVDYTEIEGLLTEIEANAYQFCVLGSHFQNESDAIEIEADGRVNLGGE